jgi:hypothetical protein
LIHSDDDYRGENYKFMIISWNPTNASENPDSHHWTGPQANLQSLYVHPDRAIRLHIHDLTTANACVQLGQRAVNEDTRPTAH